MSSNSPVRVRLRYAAFETFIEKFAPNVTRGGVFLASRSPFPVGTSFKFEIQLAGGEVALAGEGKVTWVKEFDPAAPQKAHGMGVQFLTLDGPSRDTLNRMLSRKASTSAGVVRAVIGGASSTAHRSGANGTSAPRIDTNVDLAAELGVDESRLRRATDRSRLSPGRASTEMDELDALLRPEAIEPVGIAQALAELPRLLDPNARRMTAGLRSVPDPVGANGTNGTEKTSLERDPERVPLPPR